VVYDPAMAREDPQMKIRLPEPLKERIEEAARESGRSMNAEIAWRLEESFNGKAGQAAEREAKSMSRLLDEQLRTRLQDVRGRIADHEFSRMSLEFELDRLEKHIATLKEGDDKVAAKDRRDFMTRQMGSLREVIQSLKAERDQLDGQLEQGSV
jgi:hypothetical protein